MKACQISIGSCSDFCWRFLQTSSASHANLGVGTSQIESHPGPQWWTTRVGNVGESHPPCQDPADSCGARWQGPEKTERYAGQIQTHPMGWPTLSLIHNPHFLITNYLDIALMYTPSTSSKACNISIPTMFDSKSSLLISTIVFGTISICAISIS